MAPYRSAGGPPRRDHGFPWIVKAMMAVIVMAAFIALVVTWSQSGAPSQLQAERADGAGPRPQDGVTSLSE